jgi:AmmeMemoRadiSam system protein A
MLSEPARYALLVLARRSIMARLNGDEFRTAHGPGELARLAGAFVTLTARGQLRGCIGNIGDDRPLADVVRLCAAAAATEDPRFRPVTVREMEHILIEVSVLSPAEPVEDVTTIQIGRDGLIVELGACRGLLLPQVAEEWGWDRTTFLRQACIKAGLAPEAWRLGARVLRFEAEVFGEAAARGGWPGSLRPRD